jgi:hypothetical protein
VELSAELDEAAKQRDLFKIALEEEKAIRLSMHLREREIFQHIKQLLRSKGIEYKQIAVILSFLLQIIIPSSLIHSY